ncbi:hypothetical protein HB162lentus_17090 [Mammaliicoccus lentus]
MLPFTVQLNTHFTLNFKYPIQLLSKLLIQINNLCYTLEYKFKILIISNDEKRYVDE